MKIIVLISAVIGVSYALQSQDADDVTDDESLLRRFADVRSANFGKTVGLTGEEIEAGLCCAKTYNALPGTCSEDVVKLTKCIVEITIKVKGAGKTIKEACDEFTPILCEEEEDDEEEREVSARKRGFWGKLVKALKFAHRVLNAIFSKR